MDKTLQLTADHLYLGDKVQLFEGPYGWGTVVKMGEQEVHIFRPYVHISETVYHGDSLIHYIGTETVKLWRDSKRLLTVDAYTHEREGLRIRKLREELAAIEEGSD